jgi:hypothetical protein
MTRFEWEESNEDEDGEICISLGIVTDDPQVVARARRALRMILDDMQPELRTVSPLK